MVCGAAFAWASMAVPACNRIWSRVKLTISAAMSVSRMRLSEAERFSVVTWRFAMVDSNRFWSAPSLPRRAETDAIAASTSVAAVAFWDVHELADAEHSAVGDNIVVRHARDAATQARVRDALHHSLDAWWQFFDGIHAAI